MCIIYIYLTHILYILILSVVDSISHTANPLQRRCAIRQRLLGFRFRFDAGSYGPTRQKIQLPSGYLTLPWKITMLLIGKPL